MKCNPETSYPALYACIGWLLAKKRENCAFLWLKFDPFPKNVLHQGCENALKSLFRMLFWGSSVHCRTKNGIQDVQCAQFGASGLNVVS